MYNIQTTNLNAYRNQLLIVNTYVCMYAYVATDTSIAKYLNISPILQN